MNGCPQNTPIARILHLAQHVVDVAKVTLSGFLPLSLRLSQVDSAKTLSLRLHAEILDIEKGLIDEATAKVKAKSDEQSSPPSIPEGAKLGTGRTRVSAWELN